MKKSRSLFRLPLGLSKDSKASSLARRLAGPLTIFLIITAGLLGFRLGTFNDLSPIELRAIENNQYIQHIGGAPLNLPYKLLSHTTMQLPSGSSSFEVRLPSLICGLLAVALFYLIIRRWHGRRNALITTPLLITSGWLLHTGRFGAGIIAITTTILALIAASTWLSSADEDKDRGKRLLLFSIIASLALFIPAGIWFVLATAFILRADIAAHFKTATHSRRILSISILSVTLLAIAAALARHPEQAAQWIGIPYNNLPDLQLLGRYAAGSITYLFARGPFMPEVWLAHTPILDVATAGLMLLGAAFYSRRLKSTRVQLLAAFLILSIILITLNGPYALAYTAPLLYLLAATGLVYLLHQWAIVFPRNPIARKLAMALGVILLLATAAYHTQRYFVAWHRSPDTRQAVEATTSAVPLNLLQ